MSTNPKSNYLAHKNEIDSAIHHVLDRGWYILGEEVNAFEHEFSEFLGINHTIGVGSGTDAISLALRVCGIGPGDAVITVSHTAVGTVAAICLVGTTPILIDIDPVTYNMDANILEDTVKKFDSGTSINKIGRVKAIIPVHLYGYPADMTSIIEIANRYNLYVVEDCAQSHGARINGRTVGTFGHLAAFSFYPTKNLGTLGDGGALVTDDPKMEERASMLRQYGWREKFISEEPGMNSRLDEIQAAILRVKLRYLVNENIRRCEIANIYNDSLKSTPLVIPQVQSGMGHVYYQYVVRTERRDDLRNFLNSRSVETSIHYPMPVHSQPGYRDRVVVGPSGLKNSELVSTEVISLPIHPQMTDEDVQYICTMIERWYKDQNEN